MNKTVGRKPNFKTVTYSSEEMGLITKAWRRGSLAKVPANPKLITYQQSGNVVVIEECLGMEPTRWDVSDGLTISFWKIIKE